MGNNKSKVGTTASHHHSPVFCTPVTTYPSHTTYTPHAKCSLFKTCTSDTTYSHRADVKKMIYECYTLIKPNSDLTLGYNFNITQTFFGFVRMCHEIDLLARDENVYIGIGMVSDSFGYQRMRNDGRDGLYEYKPTTFNLKNIIHPTTFFETYPDLKKPAIRNSFSILKYFKIEDLTFELCMEAVSALPSSLQYVGKHTPENYQTLCVTAVKLCGRALQYVKATDVTNYTEICVIAIKDNIYSITSLEYVNPLFVNYTEICMLACGIYRHYPPALKFVNKTEISEEDFNKLCIIAVRSNPSNLEFVTNQTIDMCYEACKYQENRHLLKFVNSSLLDECVVRIQKYTLDINVKQTNRQNKMLERVKIDGLALEFCDWHDQTEEICLAAVKQNGFAIKYSQCNTEDIYIAAVKQNGLALKFCDYQSPNVCLAAVKQNGLALKYVRQQERDYDYDNDYNNDPMYTYRLCSTALRKNGMALKYVEKKTYELCYIAIQQNKSAIKFVDECEIGYESYQLLYEDSKGSDDSDDESKESDDESNDSDDESDDESKDSDDESNESDESDPTY
jgi:hypothetical protein